MKNQEVPDTWELTPFQAGDTIEYNTRTSIINAHREGRILYWENGEEQFALDLRLWVEFITWLNFVCDVLNLERVWLNHNPRKPHVHSYQLIRREQRER